MAPEMNLEEKLASGLALTGAVVGGIMGLHYCLGRFDHLFDFSSFWQNAQARATVYVTMFSAAGGTLAGSLVGKGAGRILHQYQNRQH